MSVSTTSDHHHIAVWLCAGRHGGF